MNPPPDAGEQDLPEYSLETYRREGLLAPPGAEPAAHDGTGRVQLSFTVEDKEAPAVHKQVRVPPGVSVFDSASWNGIAIDSTCGGHGTCHKCKVRVSPSTAVNRHDARTPQIVEAVKAADVFLNHDDWGTAWISAHRAKQAATA